MAVAVMHRKREYCANKREEEDRMRYKQCRFQNIQKLAFQMSYEVGNALNVLLLALKDMHNAFWWEKLNVNKALVCLQ